ncbi:Bifunctional protein HldE [Rubrobacter xylanophilus DSM 9941]|uniref:D-glycero-beta-D-manno-heptose 1-phosphate adenylyltransferase n=1 Tax=Rubrobacter xylanophilus TaxID=49319 RepID=UPI001C63EC16|nr:D-glycero-beta-D-manno-heptose 1-phosphate adenylyltransferase [Rubrobacter xylanophilus]QYJ16906.1 Bifunctional protein HldE [Rubrobacter xylanophilus DSM 9941]
MSRGHLVVVGDALLDRDISGRATRLSPDAPVPVVEEETRRNRPGGAALAAALATADGQEVSLICALGRDGPGEELAELLAAAGVRVVDLGLSGPTPEKVRILASGRPMLRLDREGIAFPGPPTEEAAGLLERAPSILVSDYGRGVAANLRGLLEEAAARVPLVWDPHPRGPEPVPGAFLATPNATEAALFARAGGEGRAAAGRWARLLLERWRTSSVAVTLGAEGAVVVGEGSSFAVPAPRVAGGDPCGAGDRFASRAASLAATGASLREVVEEAVRAASAFVAAGGAHASRPGAAPPEEPADATELARRVRGRGGTVVATGGCFDLLHAGHVRMLEAARSLGDCLIVCLNSDASVRRLKGEDRPLVPQEERAAVLRALGCVDAVVVFGEDTPERVLERIRPHVFAKGGDYEVSELPEARVLARWGGEAVILPYVEGRSTSRLIREAANRATKGI